MISKHALFIFESSMSACEDLALTGLEQHVVVCHGQVRRQVSQGSHCRGSLMHELITPGCGIDPLVTSQSGVCCKRTSVSHLVVKLHSLYGCRLVLRTPYACSPAIDDSSYTRNEYTYEFFADHRT